ncbi:hypothetical protein KXW98_008308 [Aspergillus fumigatus]|uniref:Uncharacterized protein n=1 Tax=Aspergillus fumigatus TaxID=746128 RepID=A0A9P8NAP0_ASPFM|nr:hypothetical protein KXX45_007586 [Aspergillus fumigatus]KAH1282770.1 hypothetical protein KXX48_002703 [Aspergillus fumigatus]KAH1286904.1 hypothetical protein KXX30_008815 [Aspergillus fumigatus]KAH1300506.1 hypothetical protein KXX11_005179 [Aspergillus fumigatus]KAH1308981.1 hypothetical protein KXX66_001206 [Aspergillus fumigatus]
MSGFQLALDYIDAGSEEEILQHRERALDAIKKLEKALGLIQRVEPGLPSNSISVEPDVEQRPQQLSEKILTRIDKNLASIVSYARKSPETAVAPAPQKREDPRIIDAQIYYGARKKTTSMMFRTALAIRSISMEFARFQHYRRGYSRVARQVNRLSAKADQTQEATISDFIKENHIADHRTFERMITSGTKMLVLEGLFGSCVLLELLLQIPEYDKVRTTAEDLTGWYEQCQDVYDQNIYAQRATFLYNKLPLCRPKDVIQPVSYPLIGTDSFGGHMRDSDMVVSMASACPESSLKHTETSMASDQLPNIENPMDGCISTPAPLGGGNVVDGQDICVMTAQTGEQEHQSQLLSFHAQSTVDQSEISQTNYYGLNESCWSQSANAGGMSELPVHSPLSTELLHPGELVDLVNASIHPVNFVDIINTPIHPAGVADVMGCPAYPAGEVDIFCRPAQQSVQSNDNSTNPPTLGTSFDSGFARDTPTAAHPHSEMRSYADPTAGLDMRLAEGNFTNYAANSNTLLFANVFQVPQACP